MAATPALTASWIAAAALALCGAALTARLTEHAGSPLAFLALAPLLPVAGVAASYGRRWDPAHDMTLTAPIGLFRVLLLRTAVVLGTCTALSVATSLFLPSPGLAAFAWLLPSCALTGVSLVVSMWLEPMVSAGLVTGGWLTLLLLTWRSQTFTSPPGQFLMAAVLLAAVVALAAWHTGFDVEKGRRP
jgi:hypothetical protein